MKKSEKITLAIDIGGTGLKAATVDEKGELTVKKVRVATPYPCPPQVMVDTLVALVKPLPAFQRISIGFPGVVREGRVITAPHYGTEQWQDFPLADALAARLGKRPARLINDAEMQGLAVIAGSGLELVLTLGTGAGTALFRNGELMPHMELAQHPAHKGKTYNEYVGDAVLKKIGKRRWNKHVARVIEILDSLLHYDRLLIGGGNSANLTQPLPERVVTVSNDAGIQGGAMLWHPRSIREH